MVWQGTVKDIVELAVAEDRHIQLCDVVYLLTEPDAHVRQNALNKLQVGFTPLGYQFTNRIMPGKCKRKIRPSSS